MGGRSSEHEISLASARSVLESLDPERYEVRHIEIGRDGRWELPRAPQLELGKGGYEKLPVPLDGSPQPLESFDFGFPVVVKPARLGSSVGITMVGSADKLGPALDLAFQHDEKVLLEEYVSGVEIECSVLGNDEPFASIPGEIVPLVSDWYDYSAKYDEGGMDLVVPPRLDDATIAKVQELAVAAFVASDCEGMARVDFFVRENGEVVVNELNTIPGFTSSNVAGGAPTASATSPGASATRTAWNRSSQERRTLETRAGSSTPA